MGSKALFHSGNVLHTPSKAPVYMATHTPNTTPTISSHFGTDFFMKSRTTTMIDTTMKPAKNTTPQVITENGLCKSKAKRSGLCKPASASTISNSKPTITATGAIRWPTLRMLTASG